MQVSALIKILNIQDTSCLLHTDCSKSSNANLDLELFSTKKARQSEIMSLNKILYKGMYILPSNYIYKFRFFAIYREIALRLYLYFFLISKLHFPIMHSPCQIESVKYY